MYGNLKRNIIERFCESEQKKIQKLLSDIDLGDRRPTQLLNELRGLAKDRINEDFLKSLWMQRLPPHARAILQASNDDLSGMAKLADKILEQQQHLCNKPPPLASIHPFDHDSRQQRRSSRGG
ncbi:hypothetical protein ACLKA6_012837 [Drosophila palustris]